MLFHPGDWTFLHFVNLAIHEAGHLVFAPFGEVPGVAGGSILQVLVPLAFAGSFWRQRQPYGTAFSLYWTGVSIVYVANYASDARAIALPLLGGDGSIHDWNFLLARWGLLGQDRLIAGVLLGLAAVSVAAGALAAWRAGSAEPAPGGEPT
ncbi:MAG TPA: hypothetical protein VHN99_12475 [Deinococcales bacterium]|nr:hypothetical protein [Deinococcales bacterium]